MPVLGLVRPRPLLRPLLLVLVLVRPRPLLRPRALVRLLVRLVAAQAILPLLILLLQNH